MPLAYLILTLQLALALRVLLRLLRTANGTRIEPSDAIRNEPVAIVIPVLNEAARLGPCLAAAAAHGPEVASIVVVDGGSSDGTPALVGRFAARDPRIELVFAGSPPLGWTGKVWNVAAGLRRLPRTIEWVLCLDADVRPAPALARSLVAHAHRTQEPVLSVATRQRLSGPAEGVVHPACLATLVYRFGIPGHATRDVAAVQANGQCALFRRHVLEGTHVLGVARGSLCEDVTIARALATLGIAVGFHEAGALASVAMYADWRDAWRNWPRSLPMRDQYFDWRGWLGLAEILFVQALPLPLFLVACALGAGAPFLPAEGALAAIRLGMLAGMARAYVRRPWTYWLSPLADLPIVIRILASAVRRTQRWRGLTYRRDAVGRFRLVAG
jgi:dolichol-phosphate mannosyltransferase